MFVSAATSTSSGPHVNFFIFVDMLLNRRYTYTPPDILFLLYSLLTYPWSPLWLTWIIYYFNLIWSSKITQFCSKWKSYYYRKGYAPRMAYNNYMYGDVARVFINRNLGQRPKRIQERRIADLNPGIWTQCSSASDVRWSFLWPDTPEA